jgi:hypothetical protein
VPAFPQRQFGLPLGHHVPGRETDCGQAPARPEADCCSRAPDVPRRSSPSTVGGMGAAAAPASEPHLRFAAALRTVRFAPPASRVEAGRRSASSTDRARSHRVDGERRSDRWREVALRGRPVRP